MNVHLELEFIGIIKKYYNMFSNEFDNYFILSDEYLCVFQRF